MEKGTGQTSVSVQYEWEFDEDTDIVTVKVGELTKSAKPGGSIKAACRDLVEKIVRNEG